MYVHTAAVLLVASSFIGSLLPRKSINRENHETRPSGWFHQEEHPGNYKEKILLVPTTRPLRWSYQHPIWRVSATILMVRSTILLSST
jgi:hypothetical protein